MTTAVPQDVRKVAISISHRFHQKTLDVDLVDAIARAIMRERVACAELAAAHPLHIEKAPGLFRQVTPKDISSAILATRE